MTRPSVRLVVPRALTFCVALVALSAPPTTARADEPALLERDPVEWTLDNGLDVVFLGVHRAPVVSVHVWYDVGTRDDAKGKSGTAHMLEHLMFAGSKNLLPDQHARYVARIGGWTTSHTSEDTTEVSQVVPRQYLAFVLGLEAERMRGLVMTEEAITRVKEIVKRERAVDPVVEKLRSYVYGNHPYAKHGLDAEVDKLTKKDLKKMYDAFYQPNNATLIIVGDVEEAAVKQAVQEKFGKIAKGKEPKRTTAKLPDKPKTETKEGDLLATYLAFRGPTPSEPDFYTVQVMALLMGVLYQGELQAARDASMLVFIGPAASRDKWVSDVAASPTSVKEELVDAVKQRLLADFVSAVEQADGIARQIGLAKTVKKKTGAWREAYTKVRAVTVADVQRVAKQYLSQPAVNVVAPVPRRDK